MAATKNNEELRAQALDSLATGRTEISTELQRLRLQLSPARVLHRTVDDHTGLVVLSAVVAGFVPALMFFRRKPSHHRAPHPVSISMGKTPPKPLIGAFLMGAIGLMAKAVTPAMVKSVIVSPLQNFLSKKQADADTSGATNRNQPLATNRPG